MGTCVSRPIPIGKDDVATDSRGFPLIRRPASRPLPNPRPAMVTKEEFLGMLQDSSSNWVYARFIDKLNVANQCFCALDIKDSKYLRLPDYPVDTIANNASSVLDHNLYVVAGHRDTNSFHVFYPVLHAWSDPIVTGVLRREAFAASVEGRVYVFGQGDIQNAFGQVYKPSTQTWTPIPGSETLTHALQNGLSPLRAIAVLGTNIVLRGWSHGISFDVTTSSWSPASDNLIYNWYSFGRAAVVQNMLIACHCEHRQDGNHQLSIRAYDPVQDVWLPFEGLDNNFQENATRSDFMSINGRLVIYHMWYQEHLGFSVFEITKLETSVRANLLWESCFPIGNMIKEGEHFSSGLHQKSLYVYSFVEALGQTEIV